MTAVRLYSVIDPPDDVYAIGELTYNPGDTERERGRESADRRRACFGSLGRFP